MTVKKLILNLLAPDKVLHKGTLEDLVRASSDKPMGDTTARRLRELVNDRKIVKLTDLDGNTMYKLISEPTASGCAIGSTDVATVKTAMFPETSIVRPFSEWMNH